MPQKSKVCKYISRSSPNTNPGHRRCTTFLWLREGADAVGFFLSAHCCLTRVPATLIKTHEWRSRPSFYALTVLWDSINQLFFNCFTITKKFEVYGKVCTKKVPTTVDVCVRATRSFSPTQKALGFYEKVHPRFKLELWHMGVALSPKCARD
jgi:hypothetical protein